MDREGYNVENSKFSTIINYQCSIFKYSTSDVLEVEKFVIIRYSLNPLSLLPMRHQAIYNRLRRIEGQIRGIEEMLAKEKSERDILIQMTAVKASVLSSITTLVTEMLELDKEDKLYLSPKDIELILRTIK